MVLDRRLKLAYLHGSIVPCRPGTTLGPRRLPDYELVLILEGNVTYQIQRRRYAAPPGSVILARPGVRETYRWDPNGPSRHAYFHFAISQMPDGWLDPLSWPVVRTQPPPVVPALVQHVLHRIYRHTDWPARPPGREDCAVVETLLELFFEEHGAEPSVVERERPAPVNRALRFLRHLIDEDPRRPVRLGELADIAGVNEKHLCRLFHKSLGHAPIQTHRLLCLQLSLALLTRSNLTVKQIAHRCGFSDPGHFSRCFSQVFGRPPRTVREQLHAGELPPANPLPADLTPRIVW